ncbi:helix-turn-helix domain-containing protein [Rhodococcus tibetensis]|uniref:Helix-turn-helix domain-containing protein n=1 Tax=Rhodococcus tibetensis TaxID=2965064 RepID=A0ABT1QBZ9_9NOCA|nr:helix-turn-helix domain-containing protein [Rhodococcus sp. FXJ9.536]MCQ4119793.1 helix-turn-helix domain-containing protein [Rhodococcus sp. FXJ9.536]
MSVADRDTAVSFGAFRRPAAPLRALVTGYDGYRLAGFEPGIHLGLPSPCLTVIVTIDEPLDIAEQAAPEQAPGCYDTLASGIATSPVTIRHGGTQHGVQLALSPLGARALLGVPASALGAWVVALDDFVGPDARELVERLSLEPGWEGRFRILDDVLGRRVADAEIDPHLVRAWDLLVGEGAVRVAEVARDIGWSRRHLVNRFVAEYGVTPKDVARLSRFHRSHQMMKRAGFATLAEVSARCGYYDQAHMARDWRDFAGVAPSRWREIDPFSFVQDPYHDDGAE